MSDRDRSTKDGQRFSWSVVIPIEQFMKLKPAAARSISNDVSTGSARVGGTLGVEKASQIRKNLT